MKTWIGGGVAAIALGLVIRGVISCGGPSDQQMVKDAIKKEEASGATVIPRSPFAMGGPANSPPHVAAKSGGKKDKSPANKS